MKWTQRIFCSCFRRPSTSYWHLYLAATVHFPRCLPQSLFFNNYSWRKKVDLKCFLLVGFHLFLHLLIGSWLVVCTGTSKEHVCIERRCQKTVFLRMNTEKTLRFCAFCFSVFPINLTGLFVQWVDDCKEQRTRKSLQSHAELFSQKDCKFMQIMWHTMIKMFTS